ncbi:MAG: CapA family protein [Paludibacteraceae bacterium]|nr:CapA family protein [Paludibacteraceae bacterium]
MKKFVLLFTALFLFCSFLQKEHPERELLPNKDNIVIVFAGDIMGHSPQFKAALNPKTGKYNYDDCFVHVKPYIEDADFAVANLEVPLAGAPYSGYPNFSSPDALLDGLKFAGYDVMLTANNHVVDRGKAGLERTLRTIKSRDLLHAGSYQNKQQRDTIYPIILEKDSFRIALLNCTYGTNGIPVAAPNHVNMIDTVDVMKDIARCEELGSDFVILTIHWGNEYQLQASNAQKELARFFVRSGVDLIVGSHPHVVQNMEYIQCGLKNVPVFYSLGNSISNQRKPHTNGGIMLRAEINPISKSVKTSYMPVYVHKGVLNGKYQYHLICTIDYIKQPNNYKLAQADSAAIMFFDIETRKRLSNANLWDESFKSKFPE